MVIVSTSTVSIPVGELVASFDGGWRLVGDPDSAEIESAAANAYAKTTFA
jgi:hypothetical protein